MNATTINWSGSPVGRPTTDTLTDRYVWAVLKSLPEAKRTDIDRELRASIADDVEARVDGGEDADAAERAVLLALGDPATLAASYQGRTPGLIGPDLYPGYVGLLKMLYAVVLPIVAVAYVATVLAALFGSFGLFALNRYGFNLYLEIDDARRVAAELAVVQERYRFAADLHDIQGHTLHVIRLKTQLADKLLDRDPVAAHAQLQEAQELIAQTLAETRSLAFGDRHIAFASELANAEALLVAAGIDWTVSGSLPRGAHDELFGLVMREATTNVLRHAQATTVAVTLEPGRISIVNDGSARTGRTLSGLARLAERFEAVGGTLRTTTADGTFTTTAEAA